MSTIQAFKVVRPDLSSFADRGFKYRVGHARLAPKVTGKRIICRPGLLHCSPSAPEAAGYGHWPYRLLSVEVVKKDIVERRYDKYGALRLFVVEEVPVHLCWGPNGAAVEKIIRRVETLTKEEVEKLNAAWNAAWNAADAARNAADAARNAAGDTAGAVAIADLVGTRGFTQTHFDRLMGPWRRVIGDE